MVPLPPYFLFVGSLWSYNHQAKANKQGEVLKKDILTFYLNIFRNFFLNSIFRTIWHNLFLFWFCRKEKENKKYLKGKFSFSFFINIITPLSYLHFFYFKHSFVVVLICLNLILTLHFFYLQVTLDSWLFEGNCVCLRGQS